MIMQKGQYFLHAIFGVCLCETNNSDINNSYISFRKIDEEGNPRKKLRYSNMTKAHVIFPDGVCFHRTENSSNLESFRVGSQTIFYPVIEGD